MTAKARQLRSSIQSPVWKDGICIGDSQNTKSLIAIILRTQFSEKIVTRDRGELGAGVGPDYIPPLRTLAYITVMVL